MKLNKKNNIKIPVLAFIIAALSITLTYILIGIYPFGEKSILTGDLSGQYVNYLNYFRNLILGKTNIFYNFSMNLGSNCYGLFAYYVSSPLNLILLFFNEKTLTVGILLLNIIKIGLSATTMSILLEKKTNLNSIYKLILSISYALMSYNIIYSQNIMWLDGCIYLPLIILGLENILSGKKATTYIVFFTLAIISHFYIGYMIGLFTILYMAMRLVQINNSKLKDFYHNNKNILLVYLKSTLQILLLSAIIIIPVMLNLLESKSDIQSSSFGFNTYYNALDVFSKIFIGSYNTSQIEFGPPNIYCGCFSLILVIIYFFNSRIEAKERITNLLIIFFFFLCFLIEPLNLVFHMLQNPVFFPFRNSFIFSFFIILLSARSLEKTKKIELEKIFKVQGILIILIFILERFGYPYISAKNTIITIVFIITIGLLYYYNDKKICQKLLLIVITCELILNAYRIFNNFDFTLQKSYVNNYLNLNESIQKYKSNKNNFYRMESEHYRTINDPMLFNYNGFQHYSSVSGKMNKEFLTNFGIRHNLIPENASNTTLAMHSLLGIKYIIPETKDENFNLDYYTKRDSKVWENNYYLELGVFVASEKTRPTELENINLTKSPLQNQNILIQKLTGKEENLFEEQELDDYYNFSKPLDEEWYIEYTYEGVDTNAIKVVFDGKVNNSLSEVKPETSNVIYIPKKVKNIQIKVTDKNKNQSIKAKVYKYNHQAFTSHYEELKKEQLHITKNKERYLKGTIKVKEPGTLVTSLIFDRDWKVRVDGEKVSTKKIANSLLAIQLDKGKHTVEFIFTPRGFTLGLILSLFGLTWCLIDLKLSKNKKVVKKI